MIPGMPGGRQLADGLSSALAAWRASSFALAAYSGVSAGDAAGLRLSPRAAPRAPAPRAAPRGISQTPVKSASFARAAQSAGVGALSAGFGAAAAAGPKSNAA